MNKSVHFRYICVMALAVFGLGVTNDSVSDYGVTGHSVRHHPTTLLNSPPTLNMSAQGIGWLPVSSPTAGGLSGVDVVSATEVWAVGGLAWDQSLVLHYSNGNWQIVSGISNPQDRSLYGVDMVDSNNGWAVGFETYMLHYQSGSWTAEVNATSDVQRDVEMLSASDGWVVGTRYQCCPLQSFGVIRHYTGSSWVLTAPTNNPKWFFGISMVTSGDGWIVGQDGVILHYTGGIWQATTSPTTALLKAVDMVSATNGWAVGEGGVILHWNGSSWMTITSPVTNTLNSVAMTSATDGWAVGEGGIILHWDGNSWTTVTSPVTNTLNSVAMTSATDGWAVGVNGTILHYSIPASLNINYSTGSPGSYFTITGSNFPPSSTATIVVNTLTLTNTLTVDGSGSFAFLLDTSQADPGYYSVTATANPSAMTSFTLDPNSPLRPQDGSGPILNVPSGIAWRVIYLPLIQR
jgi:hypothetical protein